MVLEAVYEQDFLPCSYGFRPGRSAHQALQTLHTACMSQRLRWVLDIDIVKYFDSIPHSHLRDFLDQRVTDGIATPSRAKLFHEEPEAGNLHIRDCEG